MKSEIRKILEDFINEDDKKRNRIDYDLGKTLDKYEKKLLKYIDKKIINALDYERSYSFWRR